MELILKSNNKSKLDKILALASELGISVEKKGEQERKQAVVPQGKSVAATVLLESFGKGSGFPAIDEVRSKAWLSSW